MQQKLPIRKIRVTPNGCYVCTIPKSLAEVLGFADGDYVIFELIDGKLAISHIASTAACQPRVDASQPRANGEPT